MVDAALALPEDTRLMVLGPLARNKKGEFAELFAQMQAQGYVRFRIDGKIHESHSLPALEKNERHDIDVVIDRLKVRADAQQRLAETKDGREAVKAGFDTRSAQRLEALQATILSPQSTPEQRQQATQALLQLQGKTADDFQIVHAAGGQSLDASGVPVKVPDRLVKFSKRTGQYEEIAPPAPAAATVVRFNGSDSVASPASERVTIRRLPDSRRAISRLLMLPMLLLGTIDESIPLPLPKIDDSDE